MKTLAQCEYTERELATRLFKMVNITKYAFSKGRVAYDTIFLNLTGNKILGEIKVRNFEANKYNDYILQVDKVQGMHRRGILNNCSKLYYINFFVSNNKIEFITFDLTPRILEWQTNPPKVEKRIMNAVTCVRDQEKIYKDVIMLKYDEKLDCRGILTNN